MTKHWARGLPEVVLGALLVTGCGGGRLRGALGGEAGLGGVGPGGEALGGGAGAGGDAAGGTPTSHAGASMTGGGEAGTAAVGAAPAGGVGAAGGPVGAGGAGAAGGGGGGVPGAGQAGAAGDGGSAGTAPDPAVVALAGPRLAVGWHACAIHGTTLQCWGNNANDQLGYSGPDATVPVTIAGAWVAVAVGSEFTCGIRSDLSLWCWGITQSGCLGIGATTATRLSTPARVGDGYLRLAASGLNACAVKVDRTLWCWGDKDWGLLGTCADPGESSCNDPDAWTPIQVGTGFIDVEMGGGRAAALRESEAGTVLWTWGGGADFWRAQPTPWGGEGAPASQVACTNDGWLLREAGVVTRIDDPAAPPVLDPGAPSEVVDIAGGATSTCAIDGSGELLCRGSSVMGELGDGNWFGGTPYENVQPWTSVRAPQGAWIDVEVGVRTGCARDRDDVIWCWGENVQGQLGDGTTTNRSVPSPVGQAPPSESCFDGVASGAELRTDCGGPDCVACP